MFGTQLPTFTSRLSSQHSKGPLISYVLPLQQPVSWPSGDVVRYGNLEIIISVAEFVSVSASDRSV